MKKINSFLPISQVESLAISSKYTKKRKFISNNANKNFSIEERFKKAKELTQLMGECLPRQKETINWLFHLVVKNKFILKDASRECLAAPANYCSKSISRIISKLEQWGLIKVHQRVKKINSYAFGDVLKDDIIASSLSFLFPSLKKGIPLLFSVTSLLSINPSGANFKKNVPQHRDVILFNSFKSYKNNDMKNEVKSFEHDFVNSSYAYSKNISTSQWAIPKGVVHPDIFSRMSNIQRKKYFHANGWGHKDTDKGWVPVSQKLYDVLTCQEKWKEYTRSKK